MPWDIRPIEKELETRLKSGKEGITTLEGQEHFSNYVVARQKLIEEILPEIKAIEKNLTDHGEKHVANVLNNIYDLIGEKTDRISTMELYFLCLIALFHDVGNVHGRAGHYDMSIIYQIYGYVRGDNVKFDDEKTLVALVASKHSGRATDGSTDTIKELSEKEEGLWNKGINLRKCAAILRFADELAEGRHRTSNFMLHYHKYDCDSQIHHNYSNCSKQPYISRKDNRIALTYTLRIDSSIPSVWEDSKNIIEYIYYRVLKVNNERLYNKYYAELLSNFKRVEVVLNFIIDSVPVSIGLKQLILTDLIVPGDEDLQSIFKNDISFDIDEIIKKLKTNIHNGSPDSR